MPLHIIRQDIVKMDCDAIVCPTDPFLSGTGGADMMIHAAAGEELRQECNSVGGCVVGDAVVTGAYRLPSKYIIHTVGPIWQGGESGEEALLASCYKSCLSRAKELALGSVAFPLISTGTFGFPKDKAFRCAMNVLSEYLLENDITVYLLVYDKEAVTVSEKLMAHVAAYIDDSYVAESKRFSYVPSVPARSIDRQRSLRNIRADEYKEAQQEVLFNEAVSMPMASVCMGEPSTLEDALRELDESFSQMLLRKIDESGMTDSQCYKKANIDRKLFSKIRSDINYRPKKTTAIAFAIALELSRSETDELLKKAGFALSHSNKFDVIVEYFIDNGIYDIFTINEALFAFDQSLIGV
ncbi:MAG: macro domain-containing protein [Clostridia bacterium]|nr:macro domain-containing protein [Clostridia bacterium]